MVKCSALLKTIGARVIIDKINFEIMPGERISILGASGSGKTTLLRLMAGLDKPTSGQIYHKGVEASTSRAINAGIRMVFQRISIYPHMTVRGNLTFPLLSSTKDSAAIAKNVEEVAKLLRISHIMEQRGSRLSGGEAQRVSIGKAIINTPELLLLDEPFSSLDQNLRWSLMNEIKSVHRVLGLTTVLVTHSCDEAMYFSDRVMVLDEGKILQFSTPQAVLEEPAALRVAQLTFKPPPNLLHGRLERITQDDGEWTDDTGNLRIHVTGESLRSNQIPSSVSILWMPQHGILCSAPQDLVRPEDRLVLKGSVTDKAFWEGKVLATIKSAAALWTVILSCNENVIVGEQAEIQLPFENVLFFDSLSQQRLQLKPTRSRSGSSR